MKTYLIAVAALATAGPTCAQSITVKPLLDLRVRYEHVDQSGLAEQADSYVGMELVDPKIDFVGLARSLGIRAERASTVHDATDLLKSGLNGGGAMLIDVELDRAFKPM